MLERAVDVLGLAPEDSVVDATFGGGGHICPGRNVARMFAQVVVEALVRPDIQLALTPGPYNWLDRSTMRQLETMPLVIERAYP